ncbi:hypothetical protein VTK73DRAFT_4986 [Phialemonium thermophilum]|uniref:O-methyltransferase C-terminal domain-containing protein n=1 Tax=Phialemonium thermophilum TaxID=223376 RepID=A0ABR3XXT5_9PEZI
MAHLKELTLENLVATITESTNTITTYLKKNNIQGPSLHEDSPVSLPPVPEVLGARFKLLEAIDAMQNLVSGTAYHNSADLLFRVHDTSILDVLNQFDFYSAIPLGGSATVPEIAKKVNLPEKLVRHVLNYAVHMYYFAETAPDSGVFVHTSNSAFFARNPGASDWCTHAIAQTGPFSLHVAESYRKYSAGKEEPSQEVIESAASIADLDRTGHPVTFWDYLEHSEEGKPKGYRAALFARAMGFISDALAPSGNLEVWDDFEWGSLRDGSVIVDVGGSRGHDMLKIAQKFPQHKYIVEDRPSVEEAFNAAIPAEWRSNISFRAHDFFSPQPVQADLYYLRWILHDWPDKEAKQILQNLIPALKPGALIVIKERVKTPATDGKGNYVLPRAVRRQIALNDAQMHTAFNVFERSVDQWRELVLNADPRFEILSMDGKGAQVNKGIVKIVWRG